ncbi:hypothetical protein BH10PSE13_BH10PSE13_24940 [soil metagenome]
MSGDAAGGLAVWFDEVGQERQFVEDDGLDRECGPGFGPLRDAEVRFLAQSDLRC